MGDLGKSSPDHFFNVLLLSNFHSSSLTNYLKAFGSSIKSSISIHLRSATIYAMIKTSSSTVGEVISKGGGNEFLPFSFFQFSYDYLISLTYILRTLAALVALNSCSKSPSSLPSGVQSNVLA